MIRRRVVVRGSVQGVGFRFSLVRQAEMRSVAGWVRNRADGSVEAVFEGAHEEVEALVAWCRRGPRGTEVDSVDVTSEQAEGLAGFTLGR